MTAALLALALQDAAALLERLADDDVEVRASAEAEILRRPAGELFPLLAAAEGRPETEIRVLADRLRVVPAWAPLLEGTIRDARERVAAIADLSHPRRAAALEETTAALARLDRDAASALLVALLADPGDGTRRFALASLRRWPARDTAPLVAYLHDGRTAGLAAEALLAADDPSIVPAAVEIFCAEGPGLLGAARILEQFGAGDAAERVAAVLPERVGLLAWGIRILRATGPAAADALVALAPQVSEPRRLEIAEALAEIGGRDRTALVLTLAEHASPEDRERLRWLCGDPAWALEALAARRDAPSLDDLAEVGGPDLAPAVRKALREKPTPALRALLGAVGGPEDAPLLARDAVALDRLQAAAVPLPDLGPRLATLGPGEARRLLTVRDYLQRLNGLRAVAARKDRTALPWLLRLIDDPSVVFGSDLEPTPYRIWHYAMAALEAVTGVRTRGETAQEQRRFWRDWIRTHEASKEK